MKCETSTRPTAITAAATRLHSRVPFTLIAALGAFFFTTGSAVAQPVEWALRSNNGPSGRYGLSMAYDAARAETVLFGGYVGSPEVGNAETWAWNGTSWTQRVVSGPSGRSAPLAYDSARGVTVLFGGQTPINGNTGCESGNETWEWDGMTWTMPPVIGPSPSARFWHAMAYDAHRGVTVLFGGRDCEGNHKAETWEWDGHSWSLRATTGPSARILTGNGMAYDAARQVTVLFGGQNDTDRQTFNDTWEWDGTVWTQRLVSGPTARGGNSLAYDSQRNVTVLFGGNSAWDGHVTDGETWEWNGSAWVQQVVAGPSPRVSHGMTFDTARGVAVQFGGATGAPPPSGETWELYLHCASPSIVSQPFAQITCPTGPAAFAVTAAGSGPLSYQWQYEGGSPGAVPTVWTNLVNGVNSVGNAFTLSATGSRSRLVVVDHDPTPWPDPSPAAAFRYRCVVTNACDAAGITSGEATLSICRADFNCDGALDFFDYDDFVQAFEVGTAGSDFNGDGAIDFFDYDDFVVAFEAGC